MYLVPSQILTQPQPQLGYWIVEPLVNRTSEFYPRGGINYLVSDSCICLIVVIHHLSQQSRLKMLKKAGIQAILDHHALPGVQTAEQQFTGQ